MSLVLRIMLIVISLFSMVIMMRKIRHSKFQIEYAIFWILFSFVLIIMAIFPELTVELAKLIGIQSPVNMIFLMIIFVLMAKLFYLNIQISHLEYKVKELVQKLALNEHREMETEEAEKTDSKKEKGRDLPVKETSNGGKTAENRKAGEGQNLSEKETEIGRQD